MSLDTRRIGRTGLEVTELGFGTVALGLLPEAEAHLGEAAVLRAFELGVRLFDTAPFYGIGRAERRLGNVLRQLPRKDYVLVTKAGRLVTENDVGQPPDWQPPFDYTYDGVMRSYELSLKRLGVGRIDMLLLHDIGPMIHGDEHERHFRAAMDSGYRALAELKASGDIAAIGIGVNEWQVLEEAMAAADFDVFLLAGRYTLLEQTALESFLPALARQGATILAGGPFNSGILASGPLSGASYNYAPAPEPVLERVRAIADICERHGVPLSAAAIRFPAAHRSVSSVVFGPRDRAELETNVSQFAMPVPAALWSDLKSAGLLRADAPVPNAR